MLGEGPVGDIDATRARVVKLDEGVRRISRRSRANAELVNPDRADVAHFLGGCLEPLTPTGRAGPPDVADKVAIEGLRSRGDLEGRADARTGLDRIGERLRRVGGADRKS